MRIIFLLFFLITFSLANIGKVTTVVGDAKLKRNENTLIVTTGLVLKEKDIITTSKNSKVQLLFKDNTIITVGRNSALDISTYLYDAKNPKNSKTDFNFFKGAFKTITGKIGKINKEKFKLRTRSATIGIRGTIVVGNQNIIACTQGAITVEGAGINVNVDANELTIIQENNQPSKAKAISQDDLKSLEEKIEPQVDNEEETTSSSQEEKKEQTSSNNKAKEKKASSNEDQETVSSQKKTPSEKTTTPEDEEIIQSKPTESINNVTKDIIEAEPTPTDNTPVHNPDEFIDNVLNNTTKQSNQANDNNRTTNQDTAAQESISNELLDQATTAKTETLKEQNSATTAKDASSTLIATLPSDASLTTQVNQSTTTKDSVNSSLSTAVTTLNSAVASNSVNSSSVSVTASSSSSATSTANQALSDANSLQSSINGSYTTTLTQSQAEVTKAKTAYDNAVLEAKKASDALTEAQSKGLSATVVSQIQTEVNLANTAVSNTLNAYNDAKNELDNKRTLLNSSATTMLTNAQKAVDDATLLASLSSLLTSFENIKQAKLDTLSAKATVQSSKLATQTASTTATTESGTISTLKTSISTLKNDTVTATNSTNSATATATNSGTSNVEVAYAAKIAEDNATLAQTKASEASTKATQLATALSQLQTSITLMNTNLTATQTAYNDAVSKLAIALTNLNNAITAEASISSSNTTEKAAAQAAVTKAQSLYNEALQAKNDAQTLYTQAQNTVTNTNATTLLTNAQNDNAQAQTDASAATTTANSASTTAQTATAAAKTASNNVKTIMLAKTKKSLDAQNNKDNLNNGSHTFKLSGEKTNELLIGTDINGYTGSTQLGVFKVNENDVNNFSIVQADNLQEFFISYSDASNSTKSLAVYGNATTHTFDTTKTYMYKSFKSLNTSTVSGSFDTDVTLHFYNPALNSYTSFSKDFFQTGASKFTVGNKTSVTTIENSFNTGNDVFIDSIATTTGSGTNSFIGSQAQGTVQSIIHNNEDGTLNNNELTASFLNSTSTTSGTANKTLKGKAVLLTYESGSTGTRAENIELTISNNGANISGFTKYGNGTTITDFSGSVGALSSYYINGDIFGVKASGLSSGENGFLIAVPDGGYHGSKFAIYDDNDNPIVSDDDSSWGFWSGKNSTGTANQSIGPYATWIAGVETSTSVIDNLINGSNQTLTFNGKVLGFVDYTNPILLDDTNKVTINFEVGGGTKNMTGNMQFKSANSHQFNLDMNVTNVTNSSFSGKFAGISDSELYNGFTGKYYGDGELKSVGGSFGVRQSGKTATGVFKATKQ